MSEVGDSSGASAAPEPTTPPASPGQWLKEERERQGTTVQRIAVDMHLSTTVIEAIEHNKFASLGAPVFAKGHLRKYARLLGLPVESVLDLYHKLEDAPREVDPVPLSTRAPEPALRPGIRTMLDSDSDVSTSKASAIPWIGAIFALIIVAFAAWWMVGRGMLRHEVAKPATTRNESASQVVAKNAAQAAQTPQPTSDTAPVATPAATLPSPQPTRTTRSAGSPPPGKVRVSLRFARDSWVEVYDANGNRMIYDVGRTDAPRTVDAEPPVLLVFGDAEAVTTEANGKPVAVPKKNITGSVARFTIAADGSVH